MQTLLLLRLPFLINVSSMCCLLLSLLSLSLNLSKNQKVIYRDGKEKSVSNPTEFPDASDTSTKVVEIHEPIVKASIIVPEGQFFHTMPMPYSTLHRSCTHRIFRRHDGIMFRA